MSLTQNKRKIGILGGTFNPPHFAHIGMASAALEIGGMDEVILIPNGDPPHKKISVSAADRLAMTKLAANEAEKMLGLEAKPEDSEACSFDIIKNNASNEIQSQNDAAVFDPPACKRITVSDIEISRPGYSFLVNTLEELKKELSDAELYFIVGGDAVMSISSWYGASRIFELVNILAFKRAGGIGSNISSAVRYLERKGAKVSVVECELPEVSSSEIREKLSEGLDVSDKVPESILEYINSRGLYKLS